MLNKIQETLVEVKTDVKWIKNTLPSLASRREITIHRWILGGLFFAIFSIGCKVIGVF